MSLAKDVIKESFIAKDFHPLEYDDNTLAFVYSLPNGQANIIIDTSDNNKHISYIIANFCKVPEDKKDVLIKLMNDLNQKYRYAKFYIDEDNDINIRIDAMLPLDACGEFSVDYVGLIVDILDESYKEIMRGIWL